MQNVHTCLPGTCYDKTYAQYVFYHMKKVNNIIQLFRATEILKSESVHSTDDVIFVVRN